MGMSKILLLVEGKKPDRALVKHFYQLYNQHKEIEIVSYETNIYQFYDHLKKYASSENKIDYEKIDLPLFLAVSHQGQNRKKLTEMDFIETLLVFDLDPQDDKYSPDLLIELMENFSDSMGIGKLYLNYPMLESIEDMKSLDDNAFANSTESLDNLQKKVGKKNKYKHDVDSRSFMGNIRQNIKKIDIETAGKLIDLHRQKLEFITKLSSVSEKYLYLCQEQCRKIDEEDLVWVINTSILHLYDEYGALKGDTV